MRIIEPYQLYGSRVKRRHGKNLIVALLLVLVIASGYVGYCQIRTYATIYPSYIASDSTVPQTVNMAWPAYGQAAFGAVGYGVLSKTADHPAPIASIAKVMTALAVLKKHPLALNEQGPNITLGNSDVQFYKDYLAKDGSVVNVLPGEQISEYQALQAMLLASANNMADSLAVWAFGSLKDYLAYANQQSKLFGMNQTSFNDDASGFSPNTVSTPQDLVMLGISALENPVLAQIVGQTTAAVAPGANLLNTNLMLGKNDIIGIKTGNTDQAGNCYLFAASHLVANNNKITAIGVIMGAPNFPVVFKDSLNLLQSGYQGFVSSDIIRNNEIVAEYRPAWSAPVSVIAQNGLNSLVWEGSATTPKVSLDILKPPTELNQQVGSISVSDGSQKKTSTLILKGQIKPPSLWWRLTHPF